MLAPAADVTPSSTLAAAQKLRWRLGDMLFDAQLSKHSQLGPGQSRSGPAATLGKVRLTLAQQTDEEL